jgi:hypothetical protein
LRTSRISFSQTDRLVLVALLAAVGSGVEAQTIQRDDAPGVSQVRKPALGIRKAQLLGAAAGLALAAAFGRGHQDTVPTLRPLRSIDGLTVSAAAFYLSGACGKDHSKLGCPGFRPLGKCEILTKWHNG